MSNSIVRNRLSKKNISLSIDKDDLKKLFLLLQERANAACEIECNKASGQMDPDKLDAVIQDLKSCSPLKLTVVGSHSEELFGTIDEVFSSVSFPERVKSVYVNSELSYRTIFNYLPANNFELFLDFSKPSLLDFSLAPGDRTPNASHFEVQGSDSTWVNGVFYEINNYIAKNPSSLSFLHKPNLFYLIFWIVSVPLSFWVCYKIINYPFALFNGHSFIENIFLTYSFFLTLVLMRVLFDYSRWVYPMVQFKSKKEPSILHQAALYSIVIGIIGKIIYDAVLYFF